MYIYKILLGTLFLPTMLCSSYEKMQQELFRRAGLTEREINFFKAEKHDPLAEANDQVDWMIESVTLADAEKTNLLDSDEYFMEFPEREELCFLRKYFTQDGSGVSGKFFVLSSDISEQLKFFLERERKGIEVKFKNNQVVTIRYNLSKQYVLYLVHNEYKNFECV